MNFYKLLCLLLVNTCSLNAGESNLNNSDNNSSSQQIFNDNNAKDDSFNYIDDQSNYNNNNINFNINLFNNNSNDNFSLSESKENLLSSDECDAKNLLSKNLMNYINNSNDTTKLNTNSNTNTINNNSEDSETNINTVNQSTDANTINNNPENSDTTINTINTNANINSTLNNIDLFNINNNSKNDSSLNKNKKNLSSIDKCNAENLLSKNLMDYINNDTTKLNTNSNSDSNANTINNNSEDSETNINTINQLTNANINSILNNNEHLQNNNVNKLNIDAESFVPKNGQTNIFNNSKNNYRMNTLIYPYYYFNNNYYSTNVFFNKNLYLTNNNILLQFNNINNLNISKHNNMLNINNKLTNNNISNNQNTNNNGNKIIKKNINNNINNNSNEIMEILREKNINITLESSLDDAITALEIICSKTTKLGLNYNMLKQLIIISIKNALPILSSQDYNYYMESNYNIFKKNDLINKAIKIQKSIISLNPKSEDVYMGDFYILIQQLIEQADNYVPNGLNKYDPILLELYKIIQILKKHGKYKEEKYRNKIQYILYNRFIFPLMDYTSLCNISEQINNMNKQINNISEQINNMNKQINNISELISKEDYNKKYMAFIYVVKNERNKIVPYLQIYDRISKNTFIFKLVKNKNKKNFSADIVNEYKLSEKVIEYMMNKIQKKNNNTNNK